MPMGWFVRDLQLLLDDLVINRFYRVDKQAMPDPDKLSDAMRRTIQERGRHSRDVGGLAAGHPDAGAETRTLFVTVAGTQRPQVGPVEYSVKANLSKGGKD